MSQADVEARLEQADHADLLKQIADLKVKLASGQTEEPTVIVASFQMTKSMPNQSQLVISGHFYNKDDPAAINARLDEWVDRSERQFERAGMALRIAQRKAQVDNLDKIKERYQALVDQVQQGVKLKTQQLTEYNNGQASIEAALKVIRQMDADIAETKKRVGMA